MWEAASREDLCDVESMMKYLGEKINTKRAQEESESRKQEGEGLIGVVQ